MAASKQFRYQHSTVSTPSSTGVVSVFSDLSGVLKAVRPGGDVITVGQVFENVLSGNYPGQLGTFVTGLQPAVTGSLGSTKTFFVVQGPSGSQYGIPAYLIS